MFHDVSQSKLSKAMDFALLQVSCESISRIFFRVNAQTETVDAFEYPQLTISGSDASRLHNKTSFNTEETRGCRINRFSKCMKKRSWNVFK